ncbi:MAG: hypothetical protein M1821_001376 [Bathelium mastoideum]|nr:MAG: hypothetical protein M1821_001376 [Bathelium mastoideum]
MSTFNGIVAEFPEIRIDYFRRVPGTEPPLACFLSHVHSDHLQGLESFKAPFVYCSHATRQFLLKIEKKSQRMNFTHGILESRDRAYKHLHNVLRPLPLETPTIIELTPDQRIRVTLFDANHCPGAVMFLIEGDGKSILYTGDIRAEAWWVEAISRHASMIPYTNQLATLDRIYLDTTFAAKEQRFARFPSKRDGIVELLAKVKNYPEDTIFHFDPWTFGYEDVWIALSAALGTKIHVDRYRYELYMSLEPADGSRDAAPLRGFRVGHEHHDGCLTPDASCHIHSCERGTRCRTLENQRNIVHIVPIVSRSSDGTEINEKGAGGGMGDLKQEHGLEVDPASVERFMTICKKKTQDPSTLVKVHQLLQSTMPDSAGDSSLITDQRNLVLEGVQNFPDFLTKYGMSLEQLAIVFVQSIEASETAALNSSAELPVVITWSSATSMRALFGSKCSSDSFEHDEMMFRKYPSRRTALFQRPQEEQDPEVDSGMASLQSNADEALPAQSAVCQDEFRQQAYNAATGVSGASWASDIRLRSTAGSTCINEEEL